MNEKIKRLKINCPRCGCTTDYYGNTSRPFCSEKCRLIDLGRWADEDYQIAGEPAAPQDPESSC